MDLLMTLYGSIATSIIIGNGWLSRWGRRSMLDKEKRNQHEKQELIEAVLDRSVQKGRTIELPSIGSITSHGAGSIVINFYNARDPAKPSPDPDIAHVQRGRSSRGD